MSNVDVIRFQLKPGAVLPSLAHEGDAGYDLATYEDVLLTRGAVGRLDTGVAGVHLPAWAWGMVHTISSTRERWGLEIRTSVIDTGWRGPLFLGYKVVGRAGDGDRATTVRIPHGTRLGQLLLMVNCAAQTPVVQVALVDQGTERGVAGFGSSGA